MEINSCLSLYYEVYTQILEIFENKTESKIKLINIAHIIYGNIKLMCNVYKLVKRNMIKIKLNYNLDIKQLTLQIKVESNSITKFALIITHMHHIMYDLMSRDGSYYFSLDGKLEMNHIKRDLIYYITLCQTEEHDIIFNAFIIQYALESLFNRHFYIGMDFEYTNKKIELAQLNFEHNVSLQSFILIISPNKLKSEIMHIFINMIICNKYIKKILHGSDSLDIPYIYEHMLQNDTIKIRRFTRTLIDTRFLVEYYKLNLDQESNNKSRIYDENPDNSTIYYFGLISKEKQNQLTHMLDEMPHVNDRQWNIAKMAKSQVLYAQYDVIFLKYFYYRILYCAIKNCKNQNTNVNLNCNKNTVALYKHVLFELTQFVYLENNKITFLSVKCKEEIDPMNNFMIKKNNNVYKLIDIYKEVTSDLKTVNPYIQINKILKINHFRKIFMDYITRKIVYTVLSTKYKIYKNKNTILSDSLDNSYVFELFNCLNLYYLNDIYYQIEQQVTFNINNFIK